jgi:hypothetical protein
VRSVTVPGPKLRLPDHTEPGVELNKHGVGMLADVPLESETILT